MRKYIVAFLILALAFPPFTNAAWRSTSANDANDGYINSTNAKSIPGVGNLTVGAFVYLDATNNTSRIMELTKSGQTDFVFLLNVNIDDLNNEPFCQARTALANPEAKGNVSLPAGHWFYIRCKMDDTTLGSIDVDVFDVTSTAIISTGSGAFVVANRQAADGVLIGRGSPNTTNGMNGRIRGLSICECLETDAQTRNRIRALQPLITGPSLHTYYPLTGKGDTREVVKGFNATQNNPDTISTQPDTHILNYKY